MRILAVTNLYPNPWQPHRAAFNRQHFRLMAVEHAVRVIAPIAWTDEWAGRNKAALPPDRRIICDGLVVEHPRYIFPPRILRGWYGHLFRRSVRSFFQRAVAEFKPDVIFAPWAYPDGWAAVELGHRAGLPVVLKVVGSDIALLPNFPARRKGTAQAMRKADWVIAVSQDLAKKVVALGADPARLSVVYCGINSNVFHPGSKEAAKAKLGLEAGQKMLLSIGNLVSVKGHDVLIDACAQMAREQNDFKCHIIGQGPLKAQLEKQIASRGLEGRVELLGAMPHDQLADWYRACDLFVLPSHSEGVPNVLLEAAACGAPFVASRVGGIPEIAHIAPSILAPPADPSRLAQSINAGLGGHFDSIVSTAVRSVRDVGETVAELAGVLGNVVEIHRQRSAAMPRVRWTRKYGSPALSSLH